MSLDQLSSKKQNQKLDNDALTNLQLKKEINKQSDMDSLIQTSITHQISSLKNEAALLSKKLENQKYKNLELDTIIKTIRLKMDHERKTKAINFTDSNFQNIQSLQRKIKKYQYDLEQLNTKTNKLGSVVNEKKHKISLLRTDRVIDSGIFRNIQKELKASELEFKKLLIEKVKHQKIYQKCISDYNSLKAKAQQHFQSQQTHQKVQQTSRQSSILQSHLIYKKQTDQKMKFKQIQRNSIHCRNTIQREDTKNQQKNDKIVSEFLVKKFLINLNLKNSQQFVYYWQNLERINQNYYDKLNITRDQISMLEEKIKIAQKTIHKNCLNFYTPKTQLSKTQHEMINNQKIKNSVQKTQAQLDKELQAIENFVQTQAFQKFLKLLGLSPEIKQSINPETFTDLFKKIQSKITHLNYYQHPKLIEESTIIKTGRTEKEKRQEKLEEVMNRVKFSEESDKIMKRQEFKQEYRKMMQLGPALGSKKLLNNKKSRRFIM